MDEKEILAGLGSLKLREPELGFNPDDLATRAAQRQRNRRATLATGAGTFAVAGVAVAIMAFTGATEPLLQLSQGGASSTTSRRTTPKPPPPEHDLTAQVLRNKNHLLEVLPTVLPEAREISIQHTGQDYPNEKDGWDMTSYLTFFRDGAGPAFFNLVVTGKVATAKSMQPAPSCAPGTLPKCQRIPQPDGSVVVIKNNVMDGQVVVIQDATHYRKNGTSVYLFNDAGISDSLVKYYKEGEVGTTRSRLPFNEQQLVAMVTDPGFTIS